MLAYFLAEDCFVAAERGSLVRRFAWIVSCRAHMATKRVFVDALAVERKRALAWRKNGQVVPEFLCTQLSAGEPDARLVAGRSLGQPKGWARRGREQIRKAAEKSMTGRIDTEDLRTDLKNLFVSNEMMFGTEIAVPICITNGKICTFNDYLPRNVWRSEEEGLCLAVAGWRIQIVHIKGALPNVAADSRIDACARSILARARA